MGQIASTLLLSEISDRKTNMFISSDWLRHNLLKLVFIIDVPDKIIDTAYNKKTGTAMTVLCHTKSYSVWLALYLIHKCSVLLDY